MLSKGKLIKGESKLLNKINLDPYKWPEWESSVAPLTDNAEKTVIHNRYHSEEEIRNQIQLDTNFYDPFPPLTSCFYPEDLNKEYENQKKTKLTTDEKILGLSLEKPLLEPGNEFSEHQEVQEIEENKDQKEEIEVSESFVNEEHKEPQNLSSLEGEASITPTEEKREVIDKVTEIKAEESPKEPINSEDNLTYEEGYEHGIKQGYLKLQGHCNEFQLKSKELLEEVKIGLGKEGQEIFKGMIKTVCEKLLNYQIEEDKAEFLFHEILKNYGSLDKVLKLRCHPKVKEYLKKGNYPFPIEEDLELEMGDMRLDVEHQMISLDVKKTLDALLEDLLKKVFKS